MPGTQRPRPRLGPWWVGAALLLAGLAVFAGWDRRLLGGLLMAAGFAAWAGLRFALRDRRAGGLVVRSLGLDLVTQLGLAINVAGAMLLTLRHVDWRPLAVVDLILVVAAVVVIRRERQRRRRARG